MRTRAEVASGPQWSHKASTKQNERGSGDDKRANERKITFVRTQRTGQNSQTYDAINRPPAGTIGKAGAHDSG